MIGIDQRLTPLFNEISRLMSDLGRDAPELRNLLEQYRLDAEIMERSARARLAQAKSAVEREEAELVAAQRTLHALEIMLRKNEREVKS